jgi:formate dehydrogenase subunit gamma
MSDKPQEIQEPLIRSERTFKRFTSGQRWEHWILFFSSSVLLLTGLPQKYRTTGWSQQIISTPERLEFIQTVHHIAAGVLVLLTLFHIGWAIALMVRRKLPGDIFVTLDDFRNFGKTLAYLLFFRKKKPAFGKYNFEQKITYWFVFFGVGIMIVSGVILLYPTTVTYVLPGSVIPAAKLTHSTEAIVAAIFILIWHFFHVHIKRLNLSIFTGKLSESEMRSYHALEYEQLTGEKVDQLEMGIHDPSN